MTADDSKTIEELKYGIVSELSLYLQKFDKALTYPCRIRLPAVNPGPRAQTGPFAPSAVD